mmetsp:Transcript_18377/g.57257  ORF Transcript_18377/g.57257 Transcript_18377/m.57257 type:complete len:296 (-) Transcript_18377:958-1845(-)
MHLRVPLPAAVDGALPRLGRAAAALPGPAHPRVDAAARPAPHHPHLLLPRHRAGRLPRNLRDRAHRALRLAALLHVPHGHQGALRFVNAQVWRRALPADRPRLCDAARGLRRDLPLLRRVALHAGLRAARRAAALALPRRLGRVRREGLGPLLARRLGVVGDGRRVAFRALLVQPRRTRVAQARGRPDGVAAVDGARRHRARVVVARVAPRGVLAHLRDALVPQDVPRPRARAAPSRHLPRADQRGERGTPAAGRRLGPRGVRLWPRARDRHPRGHLRAARPRQARRKPPRARRR